MPEGEAREPEWLTRKRRIDPKLEALGWAVAPFDAAKLPRLRRNAIEEFPTGNGPADYALKIGDDILGVIEAKRLSLGPQNVLTQAERYARGVTSSPFDFDGIRVPFLYSTNGEVIWFHDVRCPLNRSRRIPSFHTPSALREMLSRDFDAAVQRLAASQDWHERLRPYQVQANQAIERAIAARKRQMLVAMVKGNGERHQR